MKDILVKYLQDNCIGYDKRQKAYQLMQVVNLKDHKTFRNLIEEIRQSKETIFICSEAGKTGGYWLATTETEIRDTIDHLELRAYEMIKTAKILREKAGM